MICEPENYYVEFCHTSHDPSIWCLTHWLSGVPLTKDTISLLIVVPLWMCTSATEMSFTKYVILTSMVQNFLWTNADLLKRLWSNDDHKTVSILLSLLQFAKFYTESDFLSWFSSVRYFFLVFSSDLKQESLCQSLPIDKAISTVK